MRESDTLVIWKLDRLARSLKQLIETVEDKDLQEAKALLKEPPITDEQVARRLGAAPSTLYLYLPGARSAVA